MIKAVIFDYDGTLMDNMHIHFESFQKALGGRKKIKERDLFLLEGGKVFPITSRLVKDLNLNEYEIRNIISRKHEIYEKAVNGLKMRPDALELIKKLRKLGYGIGLATGSPREIVEISIPPEELALFGHLTTSDETRKPKPDPEPYLKCAAGLGVRPEECVAIENSPLGVESAKGAGMICIALTSTLGKDELERADFIIDGLDEAWGIIKGL
jgi:beta-phosphoglucomutase